MRESLSSVLVLGLGKVGSLAAQLLQDAGLQVTGADSAARPERPYPCLALDVADEDALRTALADVDAVVSCLPYHFNAAIARIAHALGLHYFDLTEDVATTKAIRELSDTAQGVMAPQCGLAPGFIGIVGASLAEGFERIRAIKLRVGALPQHPTGHLGYAFNWSPEGVVNEYLNDCEVIEDGAHKFVSPLEWMETLVINGIQLEAFTTSGGLGTMCETYLDRVENLDYKSIRYPGHARYMNFFFHELLMREDRADAGRILTRAKPPVNDDVVFIHASVEGWRDGALARDEFVRAYYPRRIDGREWRAISWTTAASLAAVVELVRDGTLPGRGFLKQEQIPLPAFLETTHGTWFGAA